MPEAGSGHRTAVAAHLVVASLVGAPVLEALPASDCSSDEGGPGDVPVAVRLETDEATDDVLAELAFGGRLLV